MQTKVIKVRSVSEAASAAGEGAAALSEGKLVGFATETVYGIAAVADRPDTMDRLRELKSRPARPFSVHVGSPADVQRYVADVPMPARSLIRKAWPGPVTVLLPVGGALADKSLQAAGLYDVLVSEDSIGLRCPDQDVARLMLSGVASTVVAPSANLAGEPSPRDAAEVLASLDGKIDLLIDTGPTRLGADSTIVKFDRDGDWKIVRKGALDERMIRRLMRHKILFVCTGNTCRSPLAAGIGARLLMQAYGAKNITELRRHGVEVESAGIYAAGGSKPTPEAVSAAAEHGADISHHRSRRLTTELIKSAEMVFCMTEDHVAAVAEMSPESAHKIYRLDPASDIPDPIGAGEAAYRQTARRIELALKHRLDEGLI